MKGIIRRARRNSTRNACTNYTRGVCTHTDDDDLADQAHEVMALERRQLPAGRLAKLRHEALKQRHQGAGAGCPPAHRFEGGPCRPEPRHVPGWQRACACGDARWRVVMRDEAKVAVRYRSYKVFCGCVVSVDGRWNTFVRP